RACAHHAAADVREALRQPAARLLHETLLRGMRLEAHEEPARHRGGRLGAARPQSQDDQRARGRSSHAGTCSRAAALSRSAKYSSPSIEMRGVILSSHFGIHQFASPISAITPGTSTQRTIVASTATATDRPTPNCFTVGSPLRMNEPNTQTMISAAEVITRAVPASPSTTASWLSCDWR